MNKKTQTIALGMIGGIIGISLLANYWLTNKAAKPTVYEDFDQLLRERGSHPKTGTEQEIQETISEEIEVNTSKTEAVIPESEVQSGKVNDDQFPLQLGSKGHRVSRLQVWLLRNYGWTGEVTGVLDKKTLAQMKKYLKIDALDHATYQRLKLDKPVHQQKIIR